MDPAPDRGMEDNARHERLERAIEDSWDDLRVYARRLLARAQSQTNSATDLVQDSIRRYLEWEAGARGRIRLIADTPLEIRRVLFSILRNAALDVLRVLKRCDSPGTLSPGEVPWVSGRANTTSSDPEAAAIRSEELEETHSRILSLSPKERQAILLTLSSDRDMTIEKLAHKLGVSTEAARKTLSRAIQHVRRVRAPS